eukprot:TRINITY_DN47656_c0_g1_i1.p1 TRINITY_DN47656_c0_g1~~TRINITY_DN47656_c0_g1_i1.p1  ORF type:complete len:499 (+),score=102.74 TRINITY_DN47656_c0_g1_i1:149-1645(+)
MAGVAEAETMASGPSDGGDTSVSWEPVSCAPKMARKAHSRLEGLFENQKDPETIKQGIRMSLAKKESYSVQIFYKTEGVWQHIAKHNLFENATLAVIALNAVYIAVDTDWNKVEPLTPTGTLPLTESGWFFQLMEHAFCVYFTFEWIVRFMAFKRKCNGLRDGWFVFDSLLVFMMVMETWVLLIVTKAMGSKGGSPFGGTSVLRLFRLLRLSRLLKMLRSLPELMILIKGMVTAMKSVVYVMSLLLIITYVFAIAFTQMAVGTESIGEDFFPSVPKSMYSLLVYATLLDDLSDFMDSLRFQSGPLLLLAFIFIGLAALTVMNMLIGVLCEVVSAVAEKEREEIQRANVVEQMFNIISSLDTNSNARICYREFAEIMQKPEALRALSDVGVNPVHIVDFAELFFFEDGHPIELSFEEFIEMVMELRESHIATVKDMLSLWMHVKVSTNRDLSTVQKNIEDVSAKVDKAMDSANARNERIEGQLTELMNAIQKPNKVANS